MTSAALDLIACQAAEFTARNHERIEVMERMERLYPVRGIGPAQDVADAVKELNLLGVLAQAEQVLLSVDDMLNTSGASNIERERALPFAWRAIMATLLDELSPDYDADSRVRLHNPWNIAVLGNTISNR